jgi:hypothetical protein
VQRTESTKGILDKKAACLLAVWLSSDDDEKDDQRHGFQDFAERYTLLLA